MADPAGSDAFLVVERTCGALRQCDGILVGDFRGVGATVEGAQRVVVERLVPIAENLFTASAIGRSGSNPSVAVDRSRLASDQNATSRKLMSARHDVDLRR